MSAASASLAETSIADENQAGGLTLRLLFTALLLALIAMQDALWAFLGLPGPWWLLATLAASALVVALWHAPGWQPGPVLSWRATATLFGLAVAVYLLGGEGRFAYANTDWQVRDAVLRDLTLFPWPFAYADHGALYMLRAPLGMYLLPALIGKLGGYRLAELALLAQNALLLALVLALGTSLFAGARRRWIALGVFLGFSGMDLVGQLIAAKPLWLHLEQWAGPQYSATITQAFWVPQHGLSGWIFAAAYLCWREGRLPTVALFACMPLLALLSPLALIGAVPFALHAGLAGVGRRTLTRAQIGWPLLALALCAPSLAFLAAGSARVGARPNPPSAATYLLFILLEVGLYLLALAKARGEWRFGAATVLITGISLLIVPFGQIGGGIDFTMRASIPALAILAVMIADIIAENVRSPAQRDAKRWALIAFTVGLATPAGEIMRALAWPRSPQVRCSYFGVVPGGSPTYIAPLGAVPVAIRPPHPAIITPRDPNPCWIGPWPDAATGRESGIAS